MQQTSEILQAEGSELADTAAVDTEVLADSEKMGPRELPEGVLEFKIIIPLNTT